MRHMTDKLLTPAQVGNLLGFQPRTITRWCRDGKIEATKIGRVWRVRRSVVVLILQNQQRYVGDSDGSGN